MWYIIEVTIGDMYDHFWYSEVVQADDMESAIRKSRRMAEAENYDGIYVQCLFACDTQPIPALDIDN